MKTTNIGIYRKSTKSGTFTLTGDNGLLQKAQTAKEENEKAKELELIKLAVSAAQVAGEGKLNTTNLKNELETNLNDNDIENNLKPISDYWNYKGYKIDNNGNVEKWLPAEYRQVEYIESSGTQYIDTKIKAKSGLEVDADVLFTSVPWDGCFLGARNNDRIYLVYSYPYKFCLGYGGYYTSSTSIIEMKKYKIYSKLFNKNQILKIDNEKIFENNVDADYNMDLNLYMFSVNFAGNSGYFVNARAYQVKIYLDNNEVRNFIPCYSTTTVMDVDGMERPAGTIGLYDTVEGKFYTNQGTGTFGYGMEDGTYVAPTNN